MVSEAPTEVPIQYVDLCEGVRYSEKILDIVGLLAINPALSSVISG